MIKDFLLDALKEDIGRGDLFAPLAPIKNTKASIFSKDEGVFAGEVYLKELCDIQNLKLTLYKKDSDRLTKGELIAHIDGKISTLLSTERVALNILQHASGIATLTSEYLKLFSKSNIKLLDTRKTRPLLRELEKYSTKVGGAINHRMGLDDCLMLKDTHLATIKDLGEFIKRARASIPFTSKIECECESIDLAKSALEAGVDIIMCDNMSLESIQKVCNLREKISPSTLIEVSGNITKESVDELLTLNIDAISSGSLVHQARWLDMSMKIGQ